MRLSPWARVGRGPHQVDCFPAISHARLKPVFCFALAYNSRTGTTSGANWAPASIVRSRSIVTPCSLRARLAWAHDWVSDPAPAPVFQMLPGASFVVDGATPAKNSGSPPPALSFASPTAPRSSASSTVSLPARDGAPCVVAPAREPVCQDRVFQTDRGRTRRRPLL